MLLFRKHVDQIAITPKAASSQELSSKDILIGHASQLISQFWHSGGQLIIIGSISSAVRLISPLLKSKEQDPAVLVIDANGLNIVPLIGSHKAGADQLALDLAEDLGGKPIFTSDSKTQRRIAIDSFGDAWGWTREGSSSDWSNLMKSLSAGEQLSIFQSSGSRLWQEGLININFIGLDKRNFSSNDPSLFIGCEKGFKCSWHPRTLWVGIGCERNTSENLIARAIKQAFLRLGFSTKSIAGIATIDRKRDESGLLSLIERKGWPIRFFKSSELSSVEVPNPSKAVFLEMNTPSVAEAASLLASGEKAQLKLEKQIFHSKINESGAVTIAISESLFPFAPQIGELNLVGSGPGDLSLITQDARSALSRSVVWIGYKKYLDYLEPLRRFDQIRLDSSLTKERYRCQKALELSREGVRVALISSGDSGIYGMAGLALELSLKAPKSERPSIYFHPGISAFQMAGAKIGAPLMHDFCTISLSDLLTPWSKIEERIVAAAKSDFVIAIYNPKSKDRSWQLPKAIDIILSFRNSKTPVCVGRELGRPNEKIEINNLSSIKFDEIDMLTVLIIGNSKTYTKDGFIVTPRGYLP